VEGVLVDIGKGTQDILIPLKAKRVENWPKAVLPSPTTKLAKEIEGFSGELRLCGYTMGGGPVKKAIVNHVKKGYRVLSTPAAARTVRDDLDEVKRLGIEVVEELQGCNFYLSDLELETYRRLRELSGLNGEIEVLGVACQDHGFVKGQSDRVTRFNYLKELLKRSRRPAELYHVKRSGFLTRFDSIIEQIEREGLKGFVMDSKIAAVAGLIPYAEAQGVREFTCIDCGNGHTLVATVKDGLICGFLEHHTRMLNPQKLRSLTERLETGKITFEEVYSDGGHGALFIERVNPQRVYLVGPNREAFKELGEYAYPLGDAMLFGCAGLLEAFKEFTKEAS